MREVQYADSKGRLFILQVPDDCPPERYKLGIPVGPPDLSPLGLPEEVEVRLNNELFNRKILTRREAHARVREVENALKSALSLDVQTILICYEE